MINLKIGSLIFHLCFIMVFIFAAFNTVAQKKPATRGELNFSMKDFQHVLAEAKASHKKIFVDAYAVWCAPCKKLQETTFKDPKAADYFNRHFINISIDVEKGEGVGLAKAWRIEGLPALLILDENGNQLLNHTGYVDGKGLLEFAKEAARKK